LIAARITLKIYMHANRRFNDTVARCEAHMFDFASILERGTAVPLPMTSISLDFAQTECPLRDGCGL